MLNKLLSPVLQKVGDAEHLGMFLATCIAELWESEEGGSLCSCPLGIGVPTEEPSAGHEPSKA